MNRPIVPAAIPPPSNVTEATEALNSANEYVAEAVRLLQQIVAETWAAIADDIERMTRAGQGNWKQLNVRVGKLLDQQEQNAAWKKMKRTWKWRLFTRLIDFFVMFTAKLAALRTSEWLDRRGIATAVATAVAAVVASASATATVTVTATATTTVTASHTAVVIVTTMAHVTATAMNLVLKAEVY